MNRQMDDDTENDENFNKGKEKPFVQLSGEDGNVFFIMGRCRKALKRAGYTEEELARFVEEMTSGDYDHALQVAMKWCDVS